jgi:hypothetical protein
MKFRVTSAWVLLLTLAIGLSIPLIAQTGRAASEDRNRDGQIDTWQYYDDEGRLVTVLRDRNFDGFVDVREVLSGNRVVSRTIDQNFDHRFDLSLTEKTTDEPDITFNAVPQLFLLPRAIFVGDHHVNYQASSTLSAAPEDLPSATPSGRAPPATL